MSFSLYFLGYCDPSEIPEDPKDRVRSAPLEEASVYTALMLQPWAVYSTLATLRAEPMPGRLLQDTIAASHKACIDMMLQLLSCVVCCTICTCSGSVDVFSPCHAGAHTQLGHRERQHNLSQWQQRSRTVLAQAMPHLLQRQVAPLCANWHDM